MNKIIITVLTSSIFLILTFLSAEVKEKREDDFFRINDNIQNKELRAELEGLREEFKFERNHINEYYKEKMEEIKKARGTEIKTVKKDFSERKEILMKKYFGKMREKPLIENTKPAKKTMAKKKDMKDKKRIQKPK